MKPITLQPLSVILGSALTALVALASSAQTATGVQAIGTPLGIAALGSARSYVPAEQWTYIKIRSTGGPLSYTVPLNRRLVVTRLNGDVSDATVNGVEEGDRFLPVAPTDQGNSRVVLQPGDVLSAFAPFTIQVWGYLEPL